MKMIN